MIEKLPVDIKEVNKIFHMADIHIRLFKRKNEYKEVFKSLYEEIKKESTEDSIIVVAGDIVHAKTEMSPELIDLASEFFKNLANIRPTIITAGNHDANLNNISRMDAISPIVHALNHKNLYYLRNTGLYQIGNIIMSVMSVFDNTSNYILANSIQSNLTKIAIFHGAIYNSSTDTNWKITNEKVKTNFFDGYDIVLLGDIHKYQVLQPYGIMNKIKKPAIAYPSSLIQQNFGESPDKHGILVWDVEKREHKFKRIKNSYGFITISIDDGKIVSQITEMPEKAKLRLLVQNSTTSQLKECIADLRKVYKPIEITINRTNGNTGAEEISGKVNLSRIREVDFQNKLLEDYLKRNSYTTDEKTLLKIFEINKHLNSLLPPEDITRNITWKPKIFKFSNMFSYGTGNVIDFSKMNGLVGLFSSNASGKTSLLESLAFCLFDKCSKTYRAANILNNRKDEFLCELSLEISGEEYVISRTGSKNNNGNVNVKVNFYKVLSNGNILSLNGKDRRETDAIIRSYVGTYDDFILTAVSTQNNSVNFIDKSQTEKKDLLTAFMDITIFDHLYEMGTNEIKEYQILLKEYEKNDYDGEIEDYKSKIEKYNTEYSMLKLNKDSLSEEKKKLNDSILSLVKELINIDDEIVDIELLENTKKNLNISIDEENIKYSKYKNEIETLYNSCNQSENIVEKYNKTDMLQKYNHMIHLETQLNDLNSNIEKFKVEVGHKMEKTKKLRELKYDPNCEYCMNNVFVKDAILAKKELENDKNTARQISIDKSKLVSELQGLEYIKSQHEEYVLNSNEVKKFKMEILELESKKNNIQNKINTIKSNIQKTDDKIEKYYKSKENIEKNKIIEKDISKLKLEMSELSIELDEIEDELRETHSKIIFLDEKKKQAIESLDKIKEMEEKSISYQYYLQAIHRDSIPYELISEAVPVIEKEVNNILSQVVDFAIMLELDGKNINAKIIYDEDKIWPLEMASGMEKFITGMAIRVALVDITNLPRPNFIAIDEGFSSLDADNSSNLPTAFDYFKSQFDFVFVISHMDYIRDFVDISLDLKKQDDFSKINFE